MCDEGRAGGCPQRQGQGAVTRGKGADRGCDEAGHGAVTRQGGACDEAGQGAVTGAGGNVGILALSQW